MHGRVAKPGVDERRGHSVSIVVPTYREAENLRVLIQRIADAMSPLGRQYEVIIVDDDSRDATDQVMADLAAAGLPVRLIVRAGRRGLSSAVLRGFNEARGRLLVCMDADLSHPPEALPRLLACFDDPDVDFALGSRYVPAGADERRGSLRRLESKLAAVLARPLTNAKDPASGFFAVHRSILRRGQDINPLGYKIGLELMVKCGCKEVREVPIRFPGRKHGRSKLGLAGRLHFIKHLVRLARHKQARQRSES